VLYRIYASASYKEDKPGQQRFFVIGCGSLFTIENCPSQQVALVEAIGQESGRLRLSISTVVLEEYGR
jgi:hypothetical protein